MITVRFDNFIRSGNVLVPSGNGGFCAVTVDGHSGAGIKGTDIVCASISALAHTLVASIAMIGGIDQRREESEGHLGTVIATESLDDEKKNCIGPGDVVLHRGR